MTDVAWLRARARALRALAVRIESIEADRLRVAAGPDTWLGPTPSAVHADVTIGTRRLADACDDLRVRAARLDADADAIAAAADIASVFTSAGRTI